MTSDGKKVYMKVAGRDHIYNFVIEKIFIWHRYSCEMGYIRYLKVMTKEKYLIIGHMCARLRLWVRILVTPEKNRTRAYSCKKLRDLQKNLFLIFIPATNIYFSMQKNDVRHLCVDIGDGLRIS